MKIIEILGEESIIPELKTGDKASVIRELAQAIALNHPEINEDQLVEILLEREKLGSTGIGSGVAIPHGKLPAIPNILAAFGKSSAGVNFDSQDGQPTHLFFALVAPENSAGLHLKALAKLSRLLKNENFRKKLLDAKDRQAIYQIIREEEEKE